MTDEKFIKEARQKMSEFLIEQFCERVAICMSEGYNEKSARTIALIGVDEVLNAM